MKNSIQVVELKTKRFVIRKSLIGKNTIITFLCHTILLMLINNLITN